MDIREIYELASWYVSNYNNVNGRYNELFSKLQHNASQPEQQPVTQQLDDLTEFLSSMDTDLLSIQQVELLDQLEVWEWIGKTGAQRVEETVKKSSYDPATTRDQIDQVRRKIQEVHSYFNSYMEAVTALGIGPDTFVPKDDNFIVRVGFKNDASIENVSDLKKSSDDWYHIARGLALAANQSPDDVRVVGASNGSIWLILGVPLAVAKYLAVILKNVTSIAHDVLDVQIKAEELKQAGITTKIMEAELEKVEKERREVGIEKIKADLAEIIPAETDGNVKNALDKAIDKLIEFGSRGGDIDFVSPPQADPADDDNQQPNEDMQELLGEIDDVRELIYEYQERREQVRLLESSSDSDQSDD